MGMGFLAIMQGAWANVVRRNPLLLPGEWVAYYNGESKKGDTLWKGKAKVINGAPNPENMVAADWYSPTPEGNGLTLDPPQMGRKPGT